MTRKELCFHLRISEEVFKKLVKLGDWADMPKTPVVRKSTLNRKYNSFEYDLKEVISYLENKFKTDVV